MSTGLVKNNRKENDPLPNDDRVENFEGKDDANKTFWATWRWNQWNQKEPLRWVEQIFSLEK